MMEWKAVCVCVRVGTCEHACAGPGGGVWCLHMLELEVGWGVGQGEICI